jgi:hypothetical protein
LEEGERVEFTIEDSPKGPQAADVTSLGLGQAADVTGSSLGQAADVTDSSFG